MQTDQEREESIKNHIQGIVSDLNCMSIDDKRLAQIISSTINGNHRTLQQTFFRVFKEAIAHYGKYSYTDQRNEASRDWCNEVSEVKSYIPFI